MTKPVEWDDRPGPGEHALAITPGGGFDVWVQGRNDYTTQAIQQAGMLVIVAYEGAIYLTRAQAMAFFDLVPK